LKGVPSRIEKMVGDAGVETAKLKNSDEKVQETMDF
jgi:ribosome maturation protein Sdo1